MTRQSPDDLIASLRQRYGTGELTFRVESGVLLVSMTDHRGAVRTGGGGTIVAALRNLLNGGCANA